MGIFDIFSNKNAEKAAQDKIAGLNNAYDQASGAINTGLANATGYYNQALTPFSALSGTANNAYNSYADALGLNGAAGKTRAQSAFQNFNPGFDYQLNTGLNAIDRGAAARGMLSSGGTLAREQQYGNDLANQNYSNYLSGLGGFAGQAPAIAGQQSGIYQNLGGLNYLSGNTLANLGFNTQAGIGNANASADLGNNQASENLWSAIFDGAKLLGGALGSVPAAGSLGAKLLTLSDRRAKTAVKPVGKLADGQTVYRYRMKGDPRTQIGLMAQEVEKRNPKAVGRAGAMKTVDYKRATDTAARKASTMKVFARAT